MLQAVAITELIVCLVVWSFGFVRARKLAVEQTKIARAPLSRFGIVLQGVGFAFAFAYVRPTGFEKSALSMVISMILAPLAAFLGLSAVRHLGKQWRYEAAISPGHELIQSGPYGWLRHPIYTSMFGFLLAGCAALTWWPMMVVAVIFFVAGTEIRIRAEDRLLAEHFGESFRVYRSRVSAYVPFVR